MTERQNPFSTPEDIVEVLWRDGYHAAAELIERLSNSISRDAEWKYLKAFARENSFDDELAREQLRSLWTAFCFHHNMIVDTAEYDNALLELRNFMVNCGYPLTRWWANCIAFDLFMCKELV